MANKTLTVHFVEGHDGFIVALVEELPGCASQGRTIEEAEANIKDAIQAYFETLMEEQQESREPIVMGPVLKREKFRFEAEIVPA